MARTNDPGPEPLKSAPKTGTEPPAEPRSGSVTEAPEENHTTATTTATTVAAATPAHSTARRIMPVYRPRLNVSVDELP